LETKVSVFITTCNEKVYLPRVLSDIKQQDYGQFEVLLLESGGNQQNEALVLLGNKSGSLRYFHKPGFSRTQALNLLVKESRGDLLIRLDARSHIGPDYISRLVQLSNETGATNVGGVMWPMGETRPQQVIASLMQSPVVFGGAKFRKPGFYGEAETVYLGAFRKQDVPFQEWFDGKHPRISEDSDLNYRLQRAGKKIFIDSALRAFHFPRENLKSFFKLCFNYGNGRGIFLLKHRAVLAPRQAVILISVSLFALLFIMSFQYYFAALLVAALILVYFGLIILEAARQELEIKDKMKFTWGAFGCHFFWIIGLFFSPIQFLKDLRMHSSNSPSP